uniref:ATP synthase complex subunit 8 n=1 Tax=Chilo suppressalis TaxID=168631 RepID=F6LPT5_CHISP|nr:ATP synthase F0 subunit 8 [Chilo suppressalis]AEF33918.1 ATP synthase F0 subunit 8 [Chilo suppressalis]
MPQMMPINWIISLLFFITMFIIFNIMNYYIFINKINNKSKNFNINNKKNFNWKW